MASLVLLRTCAAVALLHGVTGLRESDATVYLGQDLESTFRDAEGVGRMMAIRAGRRAAKRRREAEAKARARRAAQQRAARKRREEARKRREAQQAAERKRRKELERKKREKEAHIRKHLRDCKWEESWVVSGECSATCGGGILTHRLQRRWVTQPQDMFGYGRACASSCAGEQCREERYSPCQMEPCPSDCSVVDLGNRLLTPGTAAAWVGGGLGCAYQFWQVEGKELKLLAETGRQLEGADPAVLALGRDAHANEPYSISTADERRIVLGFRSCSVPVPLVDPSGPPPNIAKVCIWGSAGYQDHSQTRNLTSREKEALLEFRKTMRARTWGSAYVARRAGWAGSLIEQARKGVSNSTAGVTFEGDTQEPAKAAYKLQVTMAPQPPEPPELAEEHTHVKGGVRLKFAEGGNDNGAEVEGYRVYARRFFATWPGHYRGSGHCKMELLPQCQEGLQAPCVDEELTLRHFPAGSALEVTVAGINSAGHGEAMNKFAIVRTSMKADEEWDACPVDHWTSLEEQESKDDKKETVDEAPEAGEPECRFDAPPVPQCRMQKRTDWKGSVKCDGKRYWRTFRPVDADGEDLTDCAGTLQGICTHKVPEVEETEKNRKCDAVGCGRNVLFFQTKNCCCRAGAEDQEDSQDCACVGEECTSLGLVAATDEEKSCRH